MALDVLSVMQVGVLLSALTVLFLAQAGQHFPAERRRHLRIWTIGLLLHPLAWVMLAMRGQVPDPVSISLGNGLLLLGFAEMARAVRGFQGLPERRYHLWGVVLVAVAGLAWFSEFRPHYSARVLVNSVAAAMLLGTIALAMSAAYRRDGFTAARLTGGFAAFGVLVWLWSTGARRSFGVRRPVLRSALADGVPAFVHLVVVAGIVYILPETRPASELFGTPAAYRERYVQLLEAQA